MFVEIYTCNQAALCFAGPGNTRGMLGTLGRITYQNERGQEAINHFGLVTFNHCSVSIPDKQGREVSFNVTRLMGYPNISRCASSMIYLKQIISLYWKFSNAS